MTHLELNGTEPCIKWKRLYHYDGGGHRQVWAYAAVMGGQEGKPCGWGPGYIIGAPKVQVSSFLHEPYTSCIARAKKKKC